MKKWLKRIGIAVGVVALAFGGFLLYVQITGIPKYPPGHIDLKVEATPERVARGKKFATLLCSQCHMDPNTLKLTGKRMEDAPPEFGPIFSRNITRHPQKGIGSWTDGELAYLLRTGVRRDGQYLPPYMVKLPHLSDEDLQSIIAFLRSDDPLVAAADVDPPGTTQPSFLTKLLSHVAFKALPYPTEKKAPPDASDKVAFGRYLVAGLDCFACHSADFKTMNVFEPEKSKGYLGGGNMLGDLHGGTIRSANLTPDDETGIGKWSEADFRRAVQKGFRPDNKVIRYPMAPMPEITDDEANAIYAYLRTVPKIHNAVPRIEDTVADADQGKQCYYKYGCVSCHGTAGIGLADLRHAVEHYPTDDQLKAWIKNAPSIKPGTKMPCWDGVIAEADYPPIIAYVKTLGVPAK
jgi:mono/diheme cytochrome c family protein